MSAPAPAMTYRSAMALLRQTVEDPSLDPAATQRVARVLAFLQTDVIRVGEVAALLGVTENTVKNWIGIGRFPGSYRTNGGHWRVPISTVLEMRDASLSAQVHNRTGSLPILEEFAGDPFDGFPNA